MNEIKETENQQNIRIAKSLLDEIKNIDEDRIESAIWRVVDAAGLLSRCKGLDYAETIGVEIPTGRGFRILDTKK